MSLPPYLQKLKKAAAKNLVPALVLQFFALALIFSYYNIPAFHSFWDNIGELKQKYGYRFSVVSTIIFGAIIPYVVMSLTRHVRKEFYKRDFLFLVIFWAIKGVEVDFLYRVLGHFLGGEISFRIVFIKVLIDQFVYVPFWGVPTMSLAYLWKDGGFSGSRFKKALGRQYFHENLIPLFFSNMTVWIPAVTIIYCFPLNLQLILSNMVLCFWSLVINILATNTDSFDVERVK